MADESVSKIRVAIIGGGLAGATPANALIQIPRFDIHVYESAPSFSERGAAIGLDTNAQQALEHILPSGCQELLKRAGAVPLNSVRSIVGSGPNAGQIVIDSSGDDSGVIVHRASLLRELIVPLPEKSLFTNKKLDTIKPSLTTGTVKVEFQDGDTEEFDVVIGADGIFSTVRSYVLQGEADKFAASQAGFWDCRCLVPIEKAKAVLGPELFTSYRQYGWVGDGSFIMHDVLENGTMVQCIISAIEHIDHTPTKDRKRKLTRETLTQTLKNWLDGPIANGIIELSLDQEEPYGYSQWEHKATPTYANGNVCVIGDAAHATTSWQGSGVAMSFEDVMVLQALFKNVTSSTEVATAFKAYDVIRRPRCQRIIDSSRGTGMILCGQDTYAGLDPEKLREVLAHRWDFIVGLDLDTHKMDALYKFREIRAK
ncbi:salicylate hydroxylase [Daldinia decipiens]|uniref:salicylate hydroxylase n=1 Tax=Daldinia decipiens TaxID=326647 RepID=UPI0020C57E8D|nr:salicylate hydroxylase [Daldinia decipiens]KAI1661769.1 salicylate hydroxylase [Daldinia decipiens]